MNEWIEVDVNEINKEVTKDIRGVQVKVSFSPYDVPRSYRGYRDSSTGLFVIEFKYLTDEPTRTVKPHDGFPAELEVGSNSQRIYKIKIDTKKLGVQAVKLETEPLARNVVGAIKRFGNTVSEKLRERYKMPENIIFNNRNQLFSAVAN